MEYLAFFASGDTHSVLLITGNMFGKIAKKSTGAVYNQTFCVSHDDSRENKSVCRVWQPTDRQGRLIVTCVGVSFDA